MTFSYYRRAVAGGVFFATPLLFFAVLVHAQTLPANTTTDTSTPAMEETAPSMPVAPSISNVSVTDITDTGARIDVDSEEVVQGYVEYGTSEQYGMSTPLTSEFSTSPSFLLENLSPETLYHYRVIIMDSSGTAAITGDETFTTLATPEPEQPPTQTATTTPSTSDTSTTTSTSTTTTATTTPPAPALAISNTETAVGTSTARITWQTNKSASSQIEYGTTNTYGSLSPVGTVSSSHSIALSALVPNTRYYYRAKSVTSSGETAYSTPQQFTTLTTQSPPQPPIISNVSSVVSTSSVTVSWTTSKPATSDIQYGTTTSYGATLTKDTTFKTSHTRTITTLKSSTLYHFRIVAEDESGTTALGKDRIVTTSGLTTAGPVAQSTEEVLSNISREASQAAVALQGGGGLSVKASPPRLLKVEALDGQVAFLWRKDAGVKNGMVRTLIIRKEGTETVRSRIDGEAIYDGPNTTFTDTDVENGKEYHYALYSYGIYGRFTTAARFKAVPHSGDEQINLSPREASAAAPTFPIPLTRDLSIGKSGDDVWHLQVFLTIHGYYPEALATGYFGPLTRSAAVRYQILNGITPAAGYVGPVTRGVLEQ